MSKKPNSSAEDYDVGYAKPPEKFRFKKGQSGNPKGRPKKSRNLNTLLDDELNSTLSVREGDRERRLSKREAIIKRMVQGALGGDIRQLQFLFRHLESRNDPEPFRVTAEDEAELNAMLASTTKGGADENQPD
jgi:hypothetical protein